MESTDSPNRRQWLRATTLGGMATGALLLGASSHSGASETRGIFLNVKDFGAVGDGVANDRPAIEAAIKAANPLSGQEYEKNLKGGVVFLPAGIYRVDCVKLHRNVTLMGEGMATIIRQMDGVNDAVLSPRTQFEYPLGIRDLRIKGAKHPSGDGRGIVLNTLPAYGGFTVPDGQHQISNVWIEGTQAECVYIAKDCRSTQITGCWFSKSGADGVVVDGSDTMISHCITRGHAGAGIRFNAGNVRLSNCKAFFCGGGGYVLNGSRARVSDCEAQDNWRDGFWIGRSHALLSSCLSESNQHSGFHIDPAGESLGGLCASALMATGRPEQMEGKPWAGQDTGIKIGYGELKESLLSGVTRRNNVSQLQILGVLDASTNTQQLVVGV